MTIAYHLAVFRAGPELWISESFISDFQFSATPALLVSIIG